MKEILQTTRKQTKNTSENGQVLLIVILISVFVLVIGLSVTQLTTRDTQITQIQEDASKARAAAEAGIEAAIGSGGTDDINISSLLNDDNLAGTATFDTSQSPAFTTPLISKDGQYTFYIFGYDDQTSTVITGTLGDDIVINRIEPTSSDYCSGSQAFALEVSMIDTGTGVVERFLIDECNLIDGTATEYAFGATLPAAAISPDPDVLIARVIAPSSSFDGAKIEIENASSNNWPLQGRTVISTASVGGTENENVTKKIQLFQSFPQFPAEFFVTTM